MMAVLSSYDPTTAAARRFREAFNAPVTEEERAALRLKGYQFMALDAARERVAQMRRQGAARHEDGGMTMQAMIEGATIAILTDLTEEWNGQPFLSSGMNAAKRLLITSAIAQASERYRVALGSQDIMGSCIEDALIQSLTAVVARV